MRTQARRDTTEAAIVQALEAIGVVVVRLSQAGVPDLLVYHRGQFWLLEVKASRGKLTPAQVVMRDRLPFLVVRSVGEALALFGAT